MNVMSVTDATRVWTVAAATSYNTHNDTKIEMELNQNTKEQIIKNRSVFPFPSTIANYTIQQN